MSGLFVTHRITIAESELEESFIRSSGPGGQNVNKVSSAVQLRFNVLTSPNLTDWAREGLLRGEKLTREGVLVITAQTHRTQELNRRDALHRLQALINAVAKPPKTRRPTQPTFGSKQRRLEGKSQRSATKAGRSKVAL